MKKLFVLLGVLSAFLLATNTSAQTVSNFVEVTESNLLAMVTQSSSLPFTGSGFIDQDMCYNQNAVVKQPLSLTGGNSVYGRYCPVYVTMFIASQALTCTSTNPDVSYQLLKVGTGNEWCLYFTIGTGGVTFTISDGARSSKLAFVAR